MDNELKISKERVLEDASKCRKIKQTIMKKFKIPVYWEMYDYMEVEANSLEEAIEIFDQKERSADPHGLPDGYYLDSSFERHQDTDYIIEINSLDN